MYFPKVVNPANSMKDNLEIKYMKLKLPKLVYGIATGCKNVYYSCHLNMLLLFQLRSVMTFDLVIIALPNNHAFNIYLYIE